MRNREVSALVEIEEAILRIRKHVGGMSEAVFLADEKTADAVALQLIVIGESTRLLPQSVRDEAPEIPWQDVIALRNRIVHGYKTVDHRIVWNIVEKRLDELTVAVRNMLAARGE